MQTFILMMFLFMAKEELGIAVLRFCDEDVMKNTEGVLQVIRRFIENYEKRKKHTPDPSF